MNPYTRAKSILDDHLATHPKMRHSPERETVLKIICTLHSPFTIEDVQQQIEEHAIRISKASLYNHLLLFTELGILYRLPRQFGQDHNQYEITLGKQHHMRIICSRCGRTSEFRNRSISDLLESHAYGNFNASGFSVYVFGTCKTCKKKIVQSER